MQTKTDKEIIDGFIEAIVRCSNESQLHAAITTHFRIYDSAINATAKQLRLWLALSDEIKYVIGGPANLSPEMIQKLITFERKDLVKLKRKIRVLGELSNDLTSNDLTGGEV